MICTSLRSHPGASCIAIRNARKLTNGLTHNFSRRKKKPRKCFTSAQEDHSIVVTFTVDTAVKAGQGQHELHLSTHYTFHNTSKSDNEEDRMSTSSKTSDFYQFPFETDCLDTSAQYCLVTEGCLQPLSIENIYHQENHLVHWCRSCGTTQTPLWRDISLQPDVRRKLIWTNINRYRFCNACGIRLKNCKIYCGMCFYIPKKKDLSQNSCQRCKVNPSVWKQLS
ncbi:hypothetical protein TrispH2_006989 [Trichoplax sp. H2]|nr:hypothetical protein TrispH2_006989 [Trichoplax sp. H2]|eukprot:RDD41856.1 hypothetical protein TrispH2_006989 [Trichoplax sp. H2]